jgi:hypothetical protein
MSTKLVFPCTLVLAVVGVGLVRAQDMPPPYRGGDSSRLPAMASSPELSRAPVLLTESVPPVTTKPPSTLSNWMTYARPDCCGPIGGDGPICAELYIETGLSLPAWGGLFSHVLETGWEVQGGARTLFFDSDMNAAWDVELGIGNVRNQGQHADIHIPFNELVPVTNAAPGAPQVQVQTIPVTVKNLERTYASLALGRDWFLGEPANSCDPRWRVGVDVGGRFGSARIEFHEFHHKIDVFGSALLGFHADWEYPYGCCTFQAGFRMEWAYTWMDILQSQNDSDLQDVNFLFTAGVRY